MDRPPLCGTHAEKGPSRVRCVVHIAYSTSMARSTRADTANEAALDAAPAEFLGLLVVSVVLSFTGIVTCEKAPAQVFVSVRV